MSTTGAALRTVPERRVYAVRYATRETRKSELFLDFEQYGEPDEPAVMDYFFWIVRDGVRTTLVDTGFDPAAGERRGRTCVCPPLDALTKLGIERKSVEQIVLTHLHYDHTGNVHAFPQAQLSVPAKELDYWRDSRDTIVEPAELEVIAAAEHLHRLTGDEEIAPGISTVLVGGHSPGQLVVVVETEHGQIVLASDALHYYEELERNRPFAIAVDVEEMLAGYETLRRLAAAPNARLVAGHDPAVLERFPIVADGLAAELA